MEAAGAGGDDRGAAADVAGVDAAGPDSGGDGERGAGVADPAIVPGEDADEQGVDRDVESGGRGRAGVQRAGREEKVGARMRIFFLLLFFSVA